jgi:DNA adenine methylase
MSTVRYLDQKHFPPLTYTGSKARGVQQIIQHFPECREIVSPFIGGGSLELHLFDQGWTVHAGDLAEPVANFWECLMRDGRHLHASVLKDYPLGRPITLEEYNTIKAVQRDLSLNRWKRAAATFAQSKWAFQGKLNSSGRRDKRKLSKATVDRLLTSHYHLQRSPERFQFVQADWRTTLDAHPDTFAYLDPPYPTMDRYYLERINHAELRDYVAKRPNWIMSNTDNEIVRDLYKDFEMIRPSWDYGMGKKSSEVLIFSPDLRPKTVANDPVVDEVLAALSRRGVKLAA